MLILNEKEFIKNIIETKQVPNKFSLSRIIDMLSRLYINDEENSDKKKKELIEYVKQTLTTLNLSYYYEYQYDSRITKICGKVYKERLKLREDNFVPLYQEELDWVNSFKKDRDKKFIFACLIIARYYNTEGWVNLKCSELFKLANITMTTKDRNIYIGEMIRSGHISDSLKNSNLNIKINLCKSKNVVMEINNFDNLGNQILVKVKDKTKMCECCGKLIKIKSKYDGSTKYCKDCKDDIHCEQQKQYRKRIKNV